MTDYTLAQWNIERPEDELIHFGAHQIGGRPTISIWTDASQKELYHEIALVANDDMAVAELIASAPRLKEERDELLEMVKDYLSDAPGIHAKTIRKARELIERIDRE